LPPALLRRAFTLSGVVPLGVFLVVHLVVNLRALSGDRAFDGAVGLYARVPGLALLEALLVFAPLLFHAAVGLWLIAGRRSLSIPSPYPAPVRVAVRVTGVLTLAFLALHLPDLRLHAGGARLGGPALLTLLEAELSSMRSGLPWRGVVYLVGSASAVFHFVAGLWAVHAATPRGQGERARRRAAWWAGAVGVTMWLLFADVVVYHATGARLFGGAPQEDAASVPCPGPSATAPP
jgi:succinate dehydrogenase / fumarate reductase cytochrome b subunit